MSSTGVFYVTTSGGGIHNAGTVSSLTPPSSSGGAWTEVVLYDFAGNASGNDGSNPGGLLIGPRGVLYGTTAGGGDPSGCNPGYPTYYPTGCGVFYSLTPPATPDSRWSEAVLKVFEGEYHSSVILAGNGGVLYGITSPYQYCQTPGIPGTLPNCETEGSTSIYSLTPPATPEGAWNEANVYLLPTTISGHSNLVSGADGSLYLATSTIQQIETITGYRSDVPTGQVLSLSPAPGRQQWTPTVLYNFSGAGPTWLMMDSGRVLYGTSNGGNLISGEAIYGSVWSLNPSATPGGAWAETTLYNSADAYIGTPASILAVGSDGTLYVNSYTTNLCGKGYCSSLLSLTPPVTPGGLWTVTTLHNFTCATDGCGAAALAVASDGLLYGITYDGGPAGLGSFFCLKLAIPQPTLKSEGELVNAAYFGPVAGGSIAAVFGNFYRPSALVTTQYPLPNSLEGLSIQFNSNLLAPLFYVSDLQVNIQIPWELAVPGPGESRANMSAIVNGQSSDTQGVIISPSAPGIFAINSEGWGQGAILDASNHLVDAYNPATPGSTVIQIFCTGLGPVTNQPPSGSPSPFTPLAHTTATPRVKIGGIDADVSFSGLTPGYVGLYQVNAMVPAGLPVNSATPVVISMPEGVDSNIVTIAVQ